MNTINKDSLRLITHHTDLRDKKVILRLDLNMPIKDGIIVDDYRLRAGMPTVNFLREAGAIIIIVAHIENSELNSFKTLTSGIEKYIDGLTFCEDIFSEETKDIVKNAVSGDVILFDNLRKWPGEKANDAEFAKSLAEYADLYVNDAFSVSHREHASLVGIPQHIPGFAGENVYKEVEELSKTFNPEKPFLFILGGAKFETKLPLLEKFTQSADTVYVGGALANDIYKAKGFEVGKSLVSSISVTEIAKKENVKTPQMVIVKRDQESLVLSIEEVQPNDIIFDADPHSIVNLGEKITQAKTIVWNGPLGDYEHGFTGGTQALAHAIAQSDANSIVGGGDTLASIKDLGISNDINFISTGGGAMLDFLANETLPALEYLREK